MEVHRAIMSRFSAYIGLLLLVVASTAGDLEPTFGRCCAFGANWARESQQCSTFPIPVVGVPTEQQSICITTAGICCLRYYRDKQCQKGKHTAQRGQECIISTEDGGEFYKDCCDGCKLGLVSGSMGMGCNSRFTFGFPWDAAYLHCCNQASLGTTDVDHQLSSFGSSNSNAVEFNTLYPSVTNAVALVPESEDLCARFPGKLCAHVCVPTAGSYRCQCRAGFSLSVDGKTCIQEAVTDRCQLNNPCAHICRDTGISIECSCNSGYALALDQRSCEDINECLTGVHGCIAGEQVCYNEIGSYTCINADGSLSSPGSLLLGGHSITGLGADGQRGQLGVYDIARGSEQGYYSTFPGALGAQGFPGSLSDGSGYHDITQTEGRCPPGYKFNLETRVCDDVDECEVSSGLCGHGAICQNTIGSYRCSQIPGVDCPHGFAFDLNLQSCLDIDECLLQTDNCNRTRQFCLNTQGSFTCQKRGGPTECIAGYKYSVDQQICIDVDECLEELHGCDQEEEQCRNTAGAYECDMKCDEGFQFSPALRTCVDRDECVDLPCDPGWECHNTAGSYLCNELPRSFCPAGYKPSNGTTSGCEDVDECIEGLQTCHPESEICINEIGKYRCESLGINEVDFGVNPYEALPRATFQPPVQECDEGFGYDLNTKQCLDIDECGTSLHNCTLSTERCINTLGGFICRPKRRCSPGFAPDPVTGICKDVDECSGGVAQCLPGEICVNTEGAFECRVECQDGFRYDPMDPAVCVDINECLELPCRRGTKCVNTEGSYRCTIATIATTTTITTTTTTEVPVVTTSQQPSPCPKGFGRNPNNLQCEDIDECLERVCELDQLCENTYGSYVCTWLPCDDGYRRNKNTNICLDIDECSDRSDTCKIDEECVNTPGGHNCQLKSCPEGKKRDPSNARECIDINECESSPCGTEKQCINTAGSYRCRRLDPCRSGFRRNNVSHQCEDIDECEENQPCNENERCLNTRGSYRCRTLECSSGYHRDIFGRCRDIDECETKEHDCRIPKEKCINTLGSYTCKSLPDCPRGFTRDPNTLRCVDIDECAESKHDCRTGERCFNQYGLYTCRGSPTNCTKGYRYSPSDRRCHDIDECAENLDSCEWSTQTCVNSVGSYRCVDEEPTCDFGYRYNHEQRACIGVRKQ